MLAHDGKIADRLDCDAIGRCRETSEIYRLCLDYDISTTLTCRMIHKAEKGKLLDKDSWADLMDDLASACRRIDGPTPPRSDDSAWVHTIPKVMALLEALGLAEKPADKENIEPPKPKRGRGRPKGAKNKKTLEREARERAEQAGKETQPSTV